MDAFDYFAAEIRGLLELHYIIKLNGNFSAVFEKSVESSENNLMEKQTIYINTKSAVLDIDSDLTQFYDECLITYILSQIDEVVTHGSGFSLSEILELTIQVSRYEPLRASSYIALPGELVKKKAICQPR